MTKRTGTSSFNTELSLPGGYVLMGTDASGSMGLPLKTGNNIHLSLDLGTRAVTKRIFEALSKGGKR
ncbi:MAG TPA: hypothetical protein VLX68_16895 [Chitinivibrionales bacterium]|nr:hypothetical protein [Chitinivibrionales bacterium]